jgi:hypothetical protein
VRSAIAVALVALSTRAARAEDGGRGIFVFPGVGIGVVGLYQRHDGPTFGALSLDLDVEAPWFFVGGQLALFNAGSVGLFAGGRAGAFLSQGSMAPYVAAGVGWLTEFDFESSSTQGWGLTPEIGLMLRRDQQWFRPAIVVEAFVPFAQTASRTKPLDPRWAVSIGFRLRL